MGKGIGDQFGRSPVFKAKKATKTKAKKATNAKAKKATKRKKPS